MKDDKPAVEKQTAPDETQSMIYAQLAIFVGELLSQTEPHTPDGGYTFSPEAIEGLSLLCNETGHTLHDFIKVAKREG